MRRGGRDEVEDGVVETKSRTGWSGKAADGHSRADSNHPCQGPESDPGIPSLSKEGSPLPMIVNNQKRLEQDHGLYGISAALHIAWNGYSRGSPMPARLAQQEDENWWPAICGARGGDSAVGRFGETAPGFGGSPNRPTVEVDGHLALSINYSDFLRSRPCLPPWPSSSFPRKRESRGGQPGRNNKILKIQL